LIDEGKKMLYNICMKREMPHIVYTERSESKRRFVRTDGALYVLLLLGAFAVIVLSRVAANRFGISRLYLQVGMYALLLGAGYAVYRVRLVDYLYELYDTELRVLQAVGAKQKLLLSVPLGAVTEVGPYRKTDAKAVQRVFHGARETATAVWFLRDGKPFVLCLSASETMRKKLSEAVHAEE
jgi:hypothetical protein